MGPIIHWPSLRSEAWKWESKRSNKLELSLAINQRIVRALIVLRLPYMFQDDRLYDFHLTLHRLKIVWVQSAKRGCLSSFSNPDERGCRSPINASCKGDRWNLHARACLWCDCLRWFRLKWVSYPWIPQSAQSLLVPPLVRDPKI